MSFASLQPIRVGVKVKGRRMWVVRATHRYTRFESVPIMERSPVSLEKLRSLDEKSFGGGRVVVGFVAQKIAWVHAQGLRGGGTAFPIASGDVHVVAV